MTEEQSKAFRDSMGEELKKRLELMRKSQAYFSGIADEYESLEEFTNTQKEWLELLGIELYQESPSYLSLRIQLDYTDCRME